MSAPAPTPCQQNDPEIWFDLELAQAAKALCGACPRAAECLEDALLHDDRFGIWGGLTPEERRKMRRK